MTAFKASFSVYVFFHLLFFFLCEASLPTCPTKHRDKQLTPTGTVHQLTLTSVCVGLVIHIKGHCNSGVQKQEVVSLVSLVISSFRSFHFFFSLAETGRWLGRLFWGFWGFWLPSAPQPPSGGGDGDESSKTNKRLCVTVSWRRLLQENDRKWKWTLHHVTQPWGR